MNEFQQLGVGPQAGQQQYQPELAPQGFFGSVFGAPLGGLIGRGIGGLFGNAQLGGQIGQAAGGIGGGFLPLSADPYQQLQQQQLQQLLQAQQAQQAQGQLSPQGWFGNALSQFGRPLGGLIGGIAGNQQLGNTIGGIASQVGGMLPFSVDPYQMQQGQQGQLAPQGWFGNAISQFGKPLGGLIGGIAGNPQLGSTIGGIASQLGGMLPFAAGPQQQQPLQQQPQLPQQFQQVQQHVQALVQQLHQLHQIQQQIQQQIQHFSQQFSQQAQSPAQQQPVQQAGQGQVAPQGWFGDALAQLGKPVGGLIGGLAGNQQLGSTIGGIASQIGGMLPFSVDPYQMQQLAQQAQQQALQAQQGQQGQLSPQGWFGNAISHIGKPLGGLIGGIAGNQQLGSTIGGIASQLGGMLPFSVDPYQLQQLAQQQQFAQQQLAQQQGQQLQPGQYPVYTTPAPGNTVH